MLERKISMTNTPGKVDVFFYEAFAEEVEALRCFLPPEVRAGYTPLTIQECSCPAPPSGLISIRTQSVIPPQWADLLHGILTRSTGFDHVKGFRDNTGRDIPAGYLPLYCSRAVAEQAVLLWMGLLRKLPMQMRQFTSFERDDLTGGECLGRTLLVAGVGSIGSEICRLGRALGMQDMGVDIVRRHQDVRYAGLEEGIAQADVIVCAMNLTSENRGYFRYEVLKRAKAGAVFVNISRGELSPHRDLLRLLDEGHLSGVALDVYENESSLAVSLRSGVPGSGESVRACLELSRRENVILTPHNAFNTAEALERKAGQTAEQVKQFLSERTFVWQVPS
jgi:D-lactate dehydrogenase